MGVTAAKVRPLEGAILRRRRAGGAGTMGNVVYNAADGDVEAARANAAATSEAIGVLVEVNEPGETTVADGDGCTIVTFGPVGGFDSLTPGAIYYLSDTVAGDITATAPSGAGKWAKSVGYAESAGILFVAPGITTARSSGLA